MDNFCYRRDIPKTQMNRYAEAWRELPLPRLQLRWDYKPVAKSAYRKEQAEQDKLSRMMGYQPTPERKWDCFYEMVLPIDKYDIRNEKYDVGFIIVPICWVRRSGSETNPLPCENSPTDTPFRDGAHAFWDSKALGWLPIYVVAPNGTASRKADYHDQPASWSQP